MQLTKTEDNETERYSPKCWSILKTQFRDVIRGGTEGHFHLIFKETFGVNEKEEKR